MIAKVIVRVIGITFCTSYTVFIAITGQASTIEDYCGEAICHVCSTEMCIVEGLVKLPFKQACVIYDEQNEPPLKLQVKDVICKVEIDVFWAIAK